MANPKLKGRQELKPGSQFRTANKSLRPQTEIQNSENSPKSKKTEKKMGETQKKKRKNRTEDTPRGNHRKKCQTQDTSRKRSFKIKEETLEIFIGNKQGTLETQVA